MAHFAIYGLGNALVDTEYHISDELLVRLGVEKGMMTLIDEAQLAMLEEQLRSRGELKKQASGGSAANSLIAAANFGSKVFYSCKVADDELGALYQRTSWILGSQPISIKSASAGRLDVVWSW